MPVSYSGHQSISFVLIDHRLDIFIGLNVVRALSIISLLLVFSSSILVMVDDIKAVNAFMSAKQSGDFDNSTVSADMIDCDYIE